MIFLLLSILSSTFITLIFKLITRRKINLFSSIIVNYFTACLLGFAFANYSGGFFLTINLLIAAVIVGILFIITFRLIGVSTDKAGMGVTAIACRMSMAIPILISFYLDPGDKITSPKIIGSILALIALALVSFKPDDKAKDRVVLFLPIILFFLTGITDSSVKVAQLTVVSHAVESNFSAIVFGVAGSIGLVVLAIKRRVNELSNPNVLKYGIALGIVNYGSLLFFIKALNSNVASSVIFSLNNISIVALSVVIGIAFFREKLSLTNAAGVVVAIVSLIYLSSI